MTVLATILFHWDLDSRLWQKWIPWVLGLCNNCHWNEKWSGRCDHNAFFCLTSGITIMALKIQHDVWCSKTKNPGKISERLGRVQFPVWWYISGPKLSVLFVSQRPQWIRTGIDCVQLVFGCLSFKPSLVMFLVILRSSRRQPIAVNQMSLNRLTRLIDILCWQNVPNNGGRN